MTVIDSAIKKKGLFILTIIDIFEKQKFKMCIENVVALFNNMMKI